MVNESDAGRVSEQIDRMQGAIVRLAQDLIRFDSVNQPPWGKEGPCQAYVARRLAELGLQVDVFRPDEVPGIEADPAYLHGRDYTDRPDVVGVLPGTGEGPSLHLAAHVDVMPIEHPDRWIVDPFGAEIRAGKIWGRGSIDDKDGLTGMLAALDAIRRAGYRLRGDLILSSYVDEEYAGGNGLLAIVRKGYRGDAAINCDGTGFIHWVANTGGGPFRVLIQSRVDAPLPTAEMRRLQKAYLQALGALSEVLAAGWDHPLYPPGTPHILKSAPIEIAAWEKDLSDWNWIGYGPVCGVKGYVTTLPGQEREHVKAEVARVLAEAYGEERCLTVYPPRVEWTYRFMDACQTDPDAPIVGTLGRAYQRVTGRTPEITGGVRSDLYMLALHGGVPTVSFGVGGGVGQGTDGGAHQPNERIDIEGELIPYTKALALAMMDWCGYARS